MKGEMLETEKSKNEHAIMIGIYERYYFYVRIKS